MRHGFIGKCSTMRLLRYRPTLAHSCSANQSILGAVSGCAMMEFIIWIREKKGSAWSNNAMGRCRFLGQNESHKKLVIYVPLDTKASHCISTALTTSNEISMLASEKHFNPRQNLKCSTGGAGRKNQSTARPVFYNYERNLGRNWHGLSIRHRFDYGITVFDSRRRTE